MAMLHWWPDSNGRQQTRIDCRGVDVEDWRLWRQVRLEALREAPYAFSTTLADWQGDFDSESRWRSRLATVPCNILAYLDDRVAGMASGTTPANEAVELISMWVAPFARGQGVADALIRTVSDWAARQQARWVTLVVYENNERAIAAYRRHGFEPAGPLGGDDPTEVTMRRRLAD